ncbi:hypothetical protein CryarDRAFT_3603 [Cryptosporangium arvum DSM 44712]|uniref:Uncharacterized protein n=1 Tax=Cryptosporangium arvum DSM 44712 TaxID=927661 RepID=A0A010ZUP8_9ACTN|nr:hypothetical protein CryarDRAFT_3603 [Cryptosporangium arvum DSM 44712]
MQPPRRRSGLTVAAGVGAAAAVFAVKMLAGALQPNTAPDGVDLAQATAAPAGPDVPANLKAPPVEQRYHVRTGASADDVNRCRQAAAPTTVGTPLFTAAARGATMVVFGAGTCLGSVS